MSWCCPTTQFTTTWAALGTPGHSWQFTAQAGTGIGHAGMLAAARVLAQGGLHLLLDAETLGRAQAEFRKRTQDRPYRSPNPPEVQPAFHQLA